MNCQKIDLKDKFFFDTIFEQIDCKLPKLYQPQDLLTLGAAFGMNKDLMKDQNELIKKFYAHCYGHRFLLSMTDKQALN